MIERILSDNFFLRSLRDEVAILKKSKRSRRALSGHIRQLLLDKKRWPQDEIGRAALVLWLIEGRNAEVLDNVRLYHRHEKIIPGIYGRALSGGFRDAPVP